DDDATWRRVQTEDGRVNVTIPPLLDELAALASEIPPGEDPAWPFLLSAGERRSFTANTIMRDPEWRKADPDGALRVAPADAARIGLTEGGRARLTTKRASVVVTIAIDDAMSTGHVALPHGLGVDHAEGDQRVRPGPAPNDLTASGYRDPWVGTPWHKSVAARLEAVS